MDVELSSCNMQFLFFSALVALGILSLIIGRKIFTKALGFVKAQVMRIYQQKTVEIDLQKEIAELKRATFQISEDWSQIRHLMFPIRDQISNFAKQLDTNLESVGSNLEASLKSCLDEERLRNDHRFGRLRLQMDSFKAGFDGIQDLLRRHGEFVDRLPTKMALAEAGTQTEMVRRVEKANGNGDQGQPKSAAIVIKTALMEFLKEAKLQMTLETNEVVLDLKSTIESAFSTATVQMQTNFVQFGNVGRDAMKCIAALNENMERNITTKFQESSEKLQGILELMKNLNFDVSSVKQTLDGIDGQFDEIYQKLELGCQKNEDFSDEANKNLRAVTQEWNEKASHLDETCKQLNCATKYIKDMLANVDNALCNRSINTANMVSPSPNADPALLQQPNPELEPDSIGVVLMTVQICQDKLNSMKGQIDQNTFGIKESTGVLLGELRLLTNLVKNSVETLKHVTLKIHDSEDGSEKSSKQEQAGEILNNRLETISEKTEESYENMNFDKFEVEKPWEDFDLVDIINTDLDKAMTSKCVADLAQGSKFFSID